MALLALHVLTAILDRYVTIGWAATVIPFGSPYRRLAVGLGTLAADIGAAVLLTSVLRSRLGYRWWRAVHWLAYLAWPAAFVHALTAGNDLRGGWAAVIGWGSAVVVTVAALPWPGTVKYRAAAPSPAGAQRRVPARQAARR